MTAEEIQKDFGLEKGTHLFRYFLNHVGRKFSPDPRLDSVDVYVQWPSGVRIVVQESVTIGYVYFQGTYLCLNQSGCVVDSTYYLEEELPVIRGLSIGSFALGEPLSTTDAELVSGDRLYRHDLQKYDLSRIVREIDVRDMNSIVLYTDNCDLLLSADGYGYEDCRNSQRNQQGCHAVRRDACRRFDQTDLY